LLPEGLAAGAELGWTPAEGAFVGGFTDSDADGVGPPLGPVVVAPLGWSVGAVVAWTGGVTCSAE
jgi:hypothetical protein